MEEKKNYHWGQDDPNYKGGIDPENMNFLKDEEQMPGHGDIDPDADPFLKIKREKRREKQMRAQLAAQFPNRRYRRRLKDNIKPKGIPICERRLPDPKKAHKNVPKLSKKQRQKLESVKPWSVLCIENRIAGERMHDSWMRIFDRNIAQQAVEKDESVRAHLMEFYKDKAKAEAVYKENMRLQSIIDDKKMFYKYDGVEEE